MSSMVYVDTDKDIIYEYQRDENLNLITKKFKKKSYFYYLDNKGNFNSITGEKCSRCICNTPYDMKQLKNNYVKTFEADVSLKIRHIIDEYYNKEIKKTKIRTWYLDIEVDDSKGFEDINNYKSRITAITIYDNYKNKYFTLLLNRDININNNKQSVKSFNNNEKDLLEFFIKLLKYLDPDLIVAWNITFDVPYILQRMNIVGLSINLLSRINKTHYTDTVLDIKGRMLIDLLLAYKKLTFGQLSSYALEFVSQQEFGEGKIKHKGKIEDMNDNDFLNYNLRDVDLLVMLDEKLHILEFFDTIRRLARCNMTDVLSNKRIVDSFILTKAKQKKIILPTSNLSATKIKFEGAYVKEPPEGLHDWVSSFDIKSLYPSVIMQFNMSYETIINKEYITNYPEERLVNLNNKYYFLKDNKGFAVELMEELMIERSKFKKLKSEVTDPIEKRTYDLIQYSVKVIANSFYGVTSSPFFRLYRPEIGAAITEAGREIIKYIEKHLEEKKLKIVVADSVSHESLIHTNIGVVPISRLFKKVQYIINGKEYYYPQNLETMSFDTQSEKTIKKPIKYIMRHKVNKKMYRIYFTNQDYIDVTEDHSLIGYINTNLRYKYKSKFVEVKPKDIFKDIKSGIILDRYDCFGKKSKYTNDILYLMGYFLGNGSFCHGKSSISTRISFGNDNKEGLLLLNKLKNEGYVNNIYISTHRKGDVNIYGKLRKILINDMYDIKIKKKKIPDYIFTLNKELIKSFIQGYFDSDGTVMIRDNKPIVRITSINKHYLDTIRLLLLKFNIPCSLFKENSINYYNEYTTGSQSYQLLIKRLFKFKEEIGFKLKRKHIKLQNISNTINYNDKTDYYISKIIKVEEIAYNDYVYDIEVEDTHTFYANGILVHNTDSVYVKINKNNYDDVLSESKLIHSDINKLWEPLLSKYNAQPNKYMEMQHEKIYSTLLTLGVKKRYAGLVKWKDGYLLSQQKLDVKGMQIVRSDYPLKAQKFLKEIITMILNKKSKQECMEYIKVFKEDFKLGTLEEIGFPTSLKSKDSYKNNPMHKRAAENSEKYLGIPYMPNSKIRYYFIKQTPSHIIYDNVWVLKDELPLGFVIDWKRSFERIITGPLDPIFNSIGWQDQQTLTQYFTSEKKSGETINTRHTQPNP